MTIPNSLKVQFKQLKQTIPFRWAFVILFIMSLIAVRSLFHSPEWIDNHPYTQVLSLLSKVLLLFTLSVIIISLIATLISYYTFKMKVASDRDNISIQFNYPQAKNSQKNSFSESINTQEQVSLTVEFMDTNFVSTHTKLAIGYKQGIVSPFQIVEIAKNAERKKIRRALVYLNLPSIQQYDINELRFLFTDSFGLFAFQVHVPVNHLVTLLPVAETQVERHYQPQQANDELIVTQEIRKQEGEWIHFKSFESSDDVRRIVWQIYARTKELVVRRPEIYNFYSSQLEIYTSFFNKVSVSQHEEMNGLCLKLYKTAIWSFIESIKLPEGTLLKLVPDQTISVQEAAYNELLRMQLGLMLWQDKQPADTYFKNEGKSICFISSLTPVAQLDALSKSSNSSTIVFIQLSKIFTLNFSVSQIVKDIFIQSDETRLKIKWGKWSSAHQIAKNEKAINALFANTHHDFIVY